MTTGVQVNYLALGDEISNFHGTDRRRHLILGGDENKALRCNLCCQSITVTEFITGIQVSKINVLRGSL